MIGKDSLCMEWIRGGEIGCGSFSWINLAMLGKTNLPHLPPLMAVKSSQLSDAATLRNEIQILSQLTDCPRVIRCFGDQVRVENGVQTYNLFLEYAPDGSLANEIKTRGGRLPESDVRRHTRSVLEGLSGIHSRGFVHCDIKVQNILVFRGSAEVKIADFGLSKKAGVVRMSGDGRFEWRGTPLYMSPETINDNEYEAPADVWALGCAVVEMATGTAVWSEVPSVNNVYALMMKITEGDNIPEMPDHLSDDGKDFLSKCFVKDPKKRWTADMLLNHPFVAGAAELKKKLTIEEPNGSISPTCHLGFWNSDSSTCTPHSSSTTTTPATSWHQEQSNCFKWVEHVDDDVFDTRIQSLATGMVTPNWEEDSDCWILVR